MNQHNINTLCDEPGEDVKAYISELIEMNADEYIGLCKESYNIFPDSYEIDKLWLYSLRNTSEKAERKMLRLYKLIIPVMAIAPEGSPMKYVVKTLLRHIGLYPIE